jgi:predicted metalloprotease with PDZ domain
MTKPPAKAMARPAAKRLASASANALPAAGMDAPIRYRVSVADLSGHRFAVTLRIAHPAAQQRVSLPVWIPGSYLVREFAKNLLQIEARQGQEKLAVVQLDKCSWQVDCSPRQALELSYEVYAFDRSVRTAWLDASRGFFNGTSLFLAVDGQTDSPHGLTLAPSRETAAWSVATGLTPVQVTPKGFGRYSAVNYDELIDCPVELGLFWQGDFKACGVPHRFVVAGAPPSFDGKRLLADAQKICDGAIRFWHSETGVGSGSRPKPPHKRYVFMLNAVDDGYGGLEHRNSTALICTRRDLPRLNPDLSEPATPATETAGADDTAATPRQPEGYTTLLGLISHEYFHTWNVKRLRPAEFTSYDYGQENYTRLLWFFEGFTSYYDDLLLRRTGLLDDAGYLKQLSKTINQVLQTPGRAIQSVAQSSFDAWVKYYRLDENTPNVTVSYYAKGSLIALCLDLTLRAEGHGRLDDVMRQLWQRCKGGPMSEDDLAAVLENLSGRSFGGEISAWVHGTEDLPLKSLLARHGVGVKVDTLPLAQRLGLRVSEASGISIKNVLRGGLAEEAGFAAGDEWLGVDDWRLGKLDDLALYAGRASHVSALVARDHRLLRLKLAMPGPSPSRNPVGDPASLAQGSWRLVVQDAAQVGAWLAR